MFLENIGKSIKISFLLIIFLSTVSYSVFAQEYDDLIVGGISANGHPVEGLNIIVNMAMGDNYIPILNVTTDSEGQFRVHENLFGHSFLLEFTYGGISHFDELVSVNETSIVHFNLSGSIDFGIIGLEGEGVEGIHVNLINKFGYVVGHTETNHMGKGQFNGLNIEDLYMIRFESDRVPYSKVFSFDNSTSVNVDFQLLETTMSDVQFESYLHHVVVEKEGEDLSVWEGITFRNLGDKIFNQGYPPLGSGQAQGRAIITIAIQISAIFDKILRNLLVPFTDSVEERRPIPFAFSIDIGTL